MYAGDKDRGCVCVFAVYVCVVGTTLVSLLQWFQVWMPLPEPCVSDVCVSVCVCVCVCLYVYPCKKNTMGVCVFLLCMCLFGVTPL